MPTDTPMEALGLWGWLLQPFVEFGFMQNALLGCVLLSVSAAPVGVFLMLRRMSLTGDAMAHGILPGAALGYLYAGLSLGAMTVGGILAGVAVAVASGLVARHTVLREDTSLAAFYLLSLSLGVLIVSTKGNNVDLLHVLFGTVLALDDAALWLLGGVAGGDDMFAEQPLCCAFRHFAAGTVHARGLRARRGPQEGTGSMSSDLRGPDPDGLATFDVVRATDPAEFGPGSRVSDRLPASGQGYKYRLQDPALWRRRFREPIFTMAIRGAGPIVVSHADSRYATEVAIDGEDSPMFCLTMPRQGALTMIRDGVATSGTEASGLVFRAGPRTRLLTSDRSVRANVFLRAQEVEQALEHAIDERLRQPLEFVPGLDWSQGLAASLRRQLDALLAEFQRRDGVADNAVALAATTDLLLALLLRAVPHSYTAQLDSGRQGAAPACVRRAEDFMHAKDAEPIRMAQVALAAGCSLRTLNAAFRRFRGTTPLGALHAIRLERVREALRRDPAGHSIAAVAQRHGFTNLSRFGAAYRRRFGQTPSDTVRGAERAAAGPKRR